MALWSKKVPDPCSKARGVLARLYLENSSSRRLTESFSLI